MAMTNNFAKRIAGLADRPLLGNLSAYAASEAAAKVSRLAVVVVLARFLSPAEIGIAAAAIATSDILKSLTENGVGQRIIIAGDHELEAVCKTAHRIFWAWCTGLAAFQLLVGAMLWQIGGSVESVVLIGVLGLEYLLMPAGLVQCALAMRQGRLRATAAISGAQNVAANLITCALVAAFPSPFAIVLPKLIAAPVWLIGMRRLVHWKPNPVIAAAPLAPFVQFGRSVLGIEFVKALRMQADKLIIGAVLGTDALGVYFFAFNASAGISTSLGTAFSTVLFPYLSTSKDRAGALRQAMLLALAVILPVVLVQMLAAEPYVALVFGQKWAPVAPLVAILCLAAVPNMIWSVSAQWLRSGGRAGTEFVYSLAIGGAMTLTTAIAAPFGLTAIAWATLAAAITSQTIASTSAIKTAIRAGRRASSPYQLQGA